MYTSCLKRCKYDTKYFLRNKNCDKYLPWNIIANHELKKFEYPKHYPKKITPPDGKLRLVNLFFDLFKVVVNLETDIYLDRLWSESCVQSYLSSLCINTNGYE